MIKSFNRYTNDCYNHFLRNTAIGIDLDIGYVPFLIIYFIDILSYIKVIKRFFLYIGRYSTNIWLIHSFFCYYFYAVVKIVTFPKYAILGLLILFLLSYIASVMVEGFYYILGKLFNKVRIVKMEN